MLVYICINTFLTKTQQKHSCQLQSRCLQIVSGLSWHLSLLPLLAVLYFFHPQQAPENAGQEWLATSASHLHWQVPGPRDRPGLKKQGKQLQANKTWSHPLTSTCIHINMERNGGKEERRLGWAVGKGGKQLPWLYMIRVEVWLYNRYFITDTKIRGCAG